MSNAERFVQLFTERWREVEPDRFVDLFHPGGGFRHPEMQGTISREETPAYWTRVKSVMPDVRLEPKAWAAKGDTVFIEWSMTGTFRGHRLQWDGVTRFTLRGDRAIEGAAYFDTMPLWAAIDPSMKRGSILAALDS